MSCTIFNLIKLYTRDSYFLNLMNSLEILDTVQKRRIYARDNRLIYNYMAYAIIGFVPDKKWTMQTHEHWQTNPSYKLIDPSGQLWFTFRKSKKIYSRWNCEPICTIYYAAAQQNSLHESISWAVNLVRNIKPCLVFANHRNKQPHVTRAWRHRKHRYIPMWYF